MDKKLTVEEQIIHMKERGITFDLFSENSAKEYLTNNTYYFKLNAYCNLFEKYKNTPKAGQYVHLDFGQLKELASLDMHLRHLIIKTSLDLEHTIKVRFVNNSRKRCMQMQVVHDFITMLYVVDYTTTGNMKATILNNLNSLFNDRMIRNKEYFEQCYNITAVYEFTKKIIDALCAKQ